MFKAKHSKNHFAFVLFVTTFILLFIPHLWFAITLLVSATLNESLTKIMYVPLFFYCIPSAMIFGNSHFITHASLFPADIIGWLYVILFYSAVSVLITFVIYRRNRTTCCISAIIILFPIYTQYAWLVIQDKR